MRPSASRVIVLLILFPIAAAPARAWWMDGHALVDHAAFRVLPGDMPAFFREGGDIVISYCADPDTLRNRDVPGLSSTEYPEHFIDMEYLAGAQLPRSRREYFDLCHKLKVDPWKAGTLPYAILEWEERLVIAFAEHRRWPNDKRIQAKIFYIAGILSHYAADAGQPLHATVHYDGRAGADYVSPRTGIHYKMDALLNRAGLKEEEIAEGVEIKASADAMALILETINASFKRVDRTYELEGKLPAATGEMSGAVAKEAREFAIGCGRDAARLVATLMYSAWIASEKIKFPAEVKEQEKTLKRPGEEKKAGEAKEKPEAAPAQKAEPKKAEGGNPVPAAQKVDYAAVIRQLRATQKEAREKGDAQAAEAIDIKIIRIRRSVPMGDPSEKE
jgi:hypothetical protein